nr:MAG TPA: hypothetical protein [Caudoviricetes sp.]
MSIIISAASAILISIIMLGIGCAIGYHVTTSFYKKCADLIKQGDDYEQIYGMITLYRKLGIDGKCFHNEK